MNISRVCTPSWHTYVTINRVWTTDCVNNRLRITDTSNNAALCNPSSNAFDAFDVNARYSATMITACSRNRGYARVPYFCLCLDRYEWLGECIKATSLPPLLARSHPLPCPFHFDVAFPHPTRRVRVSPPACRKTSRFFSLHATSCAYRKGRDGPKRNGERRHGGCSRIPPEGRKMGRID